MKKNFLKDKLPGLTQEETENLNSPIFSNKHFISNKIGMANKHVKRCPTSLVTGGNNLSVSYKVKTT